MTGRSVGSTHAARAGNGGVQRAGARPAAGSMPAGAGRGAGGGDGEGAAPRIVSRNPADPRDEVLSVSAAGGIDVDRAVERASAAAAGWARTPAADRAEPLRLAADRLEGRAGQAADLITREVGKPITES